MIKEVCVENFTNVPLMIERGADRIELNNDLSVGGTTPSFGVIKKTVEYAHKHDVPAVVMIRPRGGNFVYNEAEQKEAIDWLSKNKVKRILTHGGPLNQPISHTLDHLKELVKKAKNKIEILPGGGITKVNVNKIVEQIKIKQVHGTKLLG